MMIKKLHLLWAFYKNLAFVLFVVNCVSWFLFFKIGMHSLTVILYFKVISSGCMVSYISSYKKSEFYYYQNMGLSRIFLWKYTLCADFVFLVLLLLLTAQFS